MSIYEFNHMFNNEERPAAYGQVMITTEHAFSGSEEQVERQISVEGFIYPLEETDGRSNAKESSSGLRIGHTKNIPKKCLLANGRNDGFVDMDKGHIMALQLGGPDVSENIVAQYSQLQRNGTWRKMEVEAWNLAKKVKSENSMLFMSIMINYIDTKSYKRSLVPSSFKVRLSRGSIKGDIEKEYTILNEHSFEDVEILWRITDRHEGIKSDKEGRKKDAKRMFDGLGEMPPRKRMRPPLRAGDVTGAIARHGSQSLHASMVSSVNLEDDPMDEEFLPDEADQEDDETSIKDDENYFFSIMPPQPVRSKRVVRSRRRKKG